MFYLDGVAVQVSQQLRRVEDLLDIIFLAFQFEIADTVNGQSVAVVPDDLRRLFQKQLRVIKKVAAPSAFQQDAVHRGGGEQGGVAEDGDQVGQHPVGVVHIREPGLSFGVGDTCLLQVDIRCLGDQPRLLQLRHLPQGFDTPFHQFLGVDADPVGGLLFDLPPQLQKLR